MKAKITKAYAIALDGRNVQRFAVGDTVEGEIAERAIAAGHASKGKGKLETKPAATLEGAGE
mgnify:CR=1 FL=1